MSEEFNFLEALKEAINTKKEWFNSTELPRLLESYRLLHTCVRNVYELLIKRGLITPDPYKLEKKISDVQAPEDSPYMENERTMVISSRFSDYESMLDFVCNYIKFSTESFTLQKIKRLLELNNSFQWTNMTLNNSKPNTRGLAFLINETKKGLSQMSLCMLNDSITKSTQALNEISGILKELSDFLRESYKLEVRINIFEHPSIDITKILSSPEAETAEIKRLFPEIMGKKPYYSELISEIVEEDQGEKKQSAQKIALGKLKVVNKAKTKKQESVNTKQMILDVLHGLALIAPVYIEIAEKLHSNVDILEGRKKTFGEKFKIFLRKLLNRPEPDLIYNFTILDPKKGTKITKAVSINTFITNLEKKANFFGILLNKNSQEVARLQKNEETAILEFVNKQISENQEILTLLEAADEYFKNKVLPANRTKIRGLKMDLIAIKNNLIKATQRRSEYISYVEERKQMKKLGITDVD